MAVDSSTRGRAHRLLSVLAALLAVAGSVTATSGNGAHGARSVVAVGEKTAVLSLRELRWVTAARKIRYEQPMQAQNLGECRKADVSRKATTVLELKHHSTILNQPAGGELYLTRLLAADEARAASLQLPRAAGAAVTESVQAAAEVPLTSGIRFQTLNYVTTIALGAGAVANFTVIVDTGSDLTWVQCKPCHACYSQQDPLFDPAGSTTYAAVPCNTSACADSLKEATGTPGTCARSGSGSERCYYALGYGDGSSSRGVLATDTLGLGGASLEGFVFGCGLSNRGLFGGTAGLMGLGRTELSLVSQTVSRFGGVFSYCLPATTSGDSTGSLSLGRGAYRNTTSVAYTRMISDPAQPPFYFMNVTGATVGGALLTASGLGARNVLIDSGTVITRLAPSTYFQMDPDCNRDECIAQSCRAAVKQVTDIMHEARVGCVRRWYAEKRKLPIQNKSQSRDIFMEPWQYLQVPPPFIGHARPGVYRAIVHWWTSAEFKRRIEEGKLKRAEMGGGSHTQGSLPMAVCIQNVAKELGAEPSIFTVWSKFHKKKNKEDGTLTWVSPNAELKDTEYRKFFATTHPDANPDTKPFDPEVAMCAGGGRKNGRLWMCDSAVDPKTVRSMREIRRDSSISSSSIQSRPTASSRAIDKIREDLENERRQREQAQAIIAQQSQIMAWFAQKMTACESQIATLLPSGATLPTVDPPPFDINTWLHASSGSNNMEFGRQPSEEETMQTSPTGGQRPNNPLHRSLF